MSFKQDLKIGQAKENEFAASLTAQGWTTTTTADKGMFSGYDVSATSGSTINTFEVKYDRMASHTNNIAVELCKKGFNDKKIPSGLSISTADFYVYCVDGDEKFYQIKTEDLIKLVNEKKYHSGFWGGDYQQSGIVLFNKDFLFSKCG